MLRPISKPTFSYLNDESHMNCDGLRSLASVLNSRSLGSRFLHSIETENSLTYSVGRNTGCPEPLEPEIVDEAFPEIL